MFLRFCRFASTPVSDSSRFPHTSETQFPDLLVFSIETRFFRTRHTNTWYERFYKKIECWYSVGEEEDSQNARVREKLLRNRNMRSPGVNRLNTINSRRRLAPAVKQSIKQTKHKHKKKPGLGHPCF